VTPEPIPSITYTLGSSVPQSTVYPEFKDSISTQFGNGFNKCLERVHYITYADGSGMYEVNSFKSINIITFISLSVNPRSYRIEVQTFDYTLIGRHDFVLNVALRSYPTATIA
jgi:hypothetical protein